MTLYSATLTLLQDASLGDGRSGGQVRTARDHIPGWVLRGALAAAWVRRHGEPSPTNQLRDEFVALFEAPNSLRFNPLYAAGAPAGLSTLEHKRGRGCGRAYDAVSYEPGAVPQECESCETTLEHAKGAVPGPKDARRREFASALTANETAAESQLFGRESLDHTKVSDFTGFVGCTPAQPQILNRLGAELVIGGSGSTRGLARISLHSPEKYDEQRAAWAADGLVLRLTSPAVFVDDLGRPSRSPDVAELEEALGVKVRTDGDGRPRLRSWVRWTSEGGWHAASGLPKPVERCVAAGSTYLIQLEGAPAAERLSGLVERGLGLRRHEGFGSLLATSSETASAPAEPRQEAPQPAARAVTPQVLAGSSLARDIPAALRNLVIADLRTLGAQRRNDPTIPASGPSAQLKIIQVAAERLPAEGLIELAGLLEAQ